MSKGKVIGGSVAAVLLAAAALIKPWEGRELEPYRDIVNVLTVCYGDTHGVENRKYSVQECEQRLQSDLGRRLVAMTQCVNRPLYEHEWAAVLSLAYNVGTQVVCGSGLVRKINEGQPATVWCYELRKWNRAGGRVVQGLINRREAELAVCLGK